MRSAIVGIVALLVSTGACWAADNGCRTDASGVRRCSDGTRYRTDAFGNMRDASGNRVRPDAAGSTRKGDTGADWATRDGKPWGGLAPDDGKRDADGKPCPKGTPAATGCGK